jgi:PAS domain S-box-containing protein
VYVPGDLKEADAIIRENPIDIIVTDVSFSHGAFADWLSLWPYPFILLAYYGEEEWVAAHIGDESSSFLMRDANFRHVGTLPIVIQKVLNIRESVRRGNIHLKISEQQYMQLVSSIPDIVYTLDGHGHFTYLNDAINQLGYTPMELIGKHFTILIAEEDIPRVSREIVLEKYKGKHTTPEETPKLFDERRTGKRMTKDLVVRLRPKIPGKEPNTRGIVYAYGEISCGGLCLPEYEGWGVGTVGIIRDVTERYLRAQEFETELRIKDHVLREIHNRIIDNLQLVSSLLDLRSTEVENQKALSAFFDAQNQIQVIALIHEQLFNSKSLEAVQIDTFIHALISRLLNIYEIDTPAFTIHINCKSFILDVGQIIPVALILNELVSASIKYGLARTEGTLNIILEQRDENPSVFLEVHDDGKGLPDHYFESDISPFDVQLIYALCEQLEGTSSWERDPENHFKLTFPYKLRSVYTLAL